MRRKGHEEVAFLYIGAYKERGLWQQADRDWMLRDADGCHAWTGWVRPAPVVGNIGYLGMLFRDVVIVAQDGELC